VDFLKLICFIDLFIDKNRKYEQLLVLGQQSFAVVKQIRKIKLFSRLSG
jgi:hypothetical protein